MSLSNLLFGFSPSLKRTHPECFSTSPSPSPRILTVPMRVLSLGMSRTGTASMQSALETLSLPCYHGFRTFSEITSYDLWLPAYELKYFNTPSKECSNLDAAFFDKLLGHMSAVTDMPAISFAEELITAYPEAKVVLVERDEEAWRKSFEQVFVKTYASLLPKLVARLDPWKVGRLRKFLVRGVAEGQFRAGSVEEFRERLVPMYRTHNEMVRRVMREKGRQSDLLEYKLGSGWEPLCKFLGKEVPDVEFPRVNETAMIQEKIMVSLIVGIRGWVRRLFVLVVPLLMILWLAWRLF